MALCGCGAEPTFSSTSRNRDSITNQLDEVLMVTHGDERYSARWKKQDKELEDAVSK